MNFEKPSQYNRYIHLDGDYYVYNLLSRAIVRLESEMDLTALQQSNWGHFNEDTIQKFRSCRIILRKDFDESIQILRLQRIIKYGNKNVRLTILPTLNCNFNCWYCYEKHTPNFMKDREVNILEKFSENLLRKNRLNQFTIDWFGGEPMLHFDSVIVPLSNKIQKLCEQHSVPFFNMITTNGALFNVKHLDCLKEIQLKKYQITLDGGKKAHNQTRYSAKYQDSYNLIINNILLLVENIPNIDMTVRINCTKENVETIPEIINSFPKEIRHKIRINIQPIWQQVEVLKGFSQKVGLITKNFVDAGFSVPSYTTLPTTPNLCYVENMLHYTIGPDLEVYKCTARDFTKESQNHVGHITEDGSFESNDNIVLYYQNSAFENKKCLGCELLPVCRVSCIQKSIEKTPIECQKEELAIGIDEIIKRIIKKRLTIK